ncbi:hypothetical protein BCR37DRAFT_390469 [Protomyces lactucae-debilis]|uniref:TOM core complex subunit Tom6 n=1 Tax=Protomyces lactucae-debilis TaxID=2754530 RepID=A0A1Y2FWR0_PROLT|nr:uncharacterized protein BCR37DRAFT_390469 [Protomyces lactucae-debilis]ORY87967.1 hypothetical protein BCR37DRAFT_390469 [Protomyces lactucae-debilis]
MAPKRINRPQAESVFSKALTAARNPENLSLVFSAGVFAGAVAFLQSQWGEYLVPQF